MASGRMDFSSSEERGEGGSFVMLTEVGPREKIKFNNFATIRLFQTEIIFNDFHVLFKHMQTLNLFLFVL